MHMVKQAKPAPSGFYTGKDAAKRLRVPLGTFYYQVRAGKFKRYSKEGNIVVAPQEGKRQEGYYLKKEIDKAAVEQELFVTLYSNEPVFYERASSEDDIRGIVEICIQIYGHGGTPSLKARLDIWRKNPYVYYVVKQEGVVVGYVSLIWFTDKALAYLMEAEQKKEEPAQTDAGRGIYSVTGYENVNVFTEGQPIESLFISLGVKPGISNDQQRRYAMRLLTGILETLEEFSQRGMPVGKLYATSATQDGVQLAKKIGMIPTKYPGDPLIRFELDLKRSDSPMAHNYREIIKQNYRVYASHRQEAQ